MAGSVAPGSWKLGSSKVAKKGPQQMHSNLTYVDTILNLAGINTEALSVHVRMIALKNVTPFRYWFSEFFYKSRGVMIMHVCSEVPNGRDDSPVEISGQAKQKVGKE